MYDGDGRRVAKANASQVPYKLYLYGSGGEILAETDGAGNNPNEYIFFGGKRIAMLPTGSTVQFYVEDSLGSSRIVTSSTGVLCYDADFYPYGGERPVTDTCTQNNYKFEGKERDTETGNDDFGARYYSNRFGRWLSADWSNVPVPVPYANLTNPQTLNLYSMVADDPETSADLDGHDLSVAPGLQADVDQMRRESTDFDNELKAHEGPGSPNLTIKIGDTPNDPDGSPTVGSTSASATAELTEHNCSTATDCTDINHPANYKGATITINSSVMSDEDARQDVLEHETGHVHDARTKTKQYLKDSQYTLQTNGKTNHDRRPEERRANDFKKQVKKQRKAWRKKHCHGILHITCGG